jgi:hypothetical protein
MRARLPGRFCWAPGDGETWPRNQYRHTICRIHFEKCDYNDVDLIIARPRKSAYILELEHQIKCIAKFYILNHTFPPALRSGGRSAEASPTN